jgi:AraC-like DNA-binding protein
MTAYRRGEALSIVAGAEDLLGDRLLTAPQGVDGDDTPAQHQCVEQLRVAELSTAAGVARRTLELAFNESLQVSPLKYARPAAHNRAPPAPSPTIDEHPRLTQE